MHVIRVQLVHLYVPSVLFVRACYGFILMFSANAVCIVYRMHSLSLVTR